VGEDGKRVGEEVKCLKAHEREGGRECVDYCMTEKW